MDEDLLRPGWPCFRSQKYLDQVKEIPSVVVNSVET